MRRFAHVLALQWYGEQEPMPPWELMDEGKLDSALCTIRPMFAGADPYPTLAAKAAALLYGVTKAHALPNGNKRIALTTTFLFVAVNGYWWTVESEQARAHVTWLAASDARLRDAALIYMTDYIEVGLDPLPFDQIPELPAPPRSLPAG